MQVKAFLIFIFLSLPNLVLAGEFDIKFGWMQQNDQGKYYVYNETSVIPLKLRDTGFRWGYEISSKEKKAFSTYSIDNLNAEIHTATGDYTKASDSPKQIKTKTFNVKSGWFSRETSNDKSDPLGHQSIDIFINDKLYKTIKFEVVKP